MGWLSGWTYRKAINVSRASGAVTDYAIRLQVGDTQGDDTDIDCGGLCNTDFSDLRFTNSDGSTVLDYWIESVAGVSPLQMAQVWVELDFVDVTETTFYMYYGNSGATDAGNATNTFIAFHGAASAPFTDSYLANNQDLHYRASLKVNTTGLSTSCGLTGQDGFVRIQSDNANNQIKCESSFDGSAPYSNITVSNDLVADIWHVLDIYLSPTTVNFYIDYSEIGTGITDAIPNEDLALFLNVAEANGEQAWSFATKYLSPEISVDSFGIQELSTSGAVAGGSAIIYGGHDVVASGGAVGGGSSYISSSIIAQTSPPAVWQDTTTPDPPGPSGAWDIIPAPVAPAHVHLTPIYGITSYTITLNATNITAQVSSCSIQESESAVFGICTLEVPVGMLLYQGDLINVTISAVTRYYMVEEISQDGPQRSVWCRSIAAVIDEPHTVESNWNGWDNPHATAHALADTLAGSVSLTFDIDDWAIPPRWELSGTPIAALQALVNACGGIVISNPDGTLTARHRWPVRPPAISSATSVATIDHDTALSISAKAVPGKGYGTVTVLGYDPASDLPILEAEDSSPAIGSTVHVRAFWPSTTLPGYSQFITDGAASKLGEYDLLITAEEVTFNNGVASTKYPIKTFHSFEWIGTDQGAIWWLANGNSKELSMASPTGRGIAEVTYTTRYERHALTGQTASKCVFGVDVSQGQVSATVSYTSGGALAPVITEAIINDTAGCVVAGTGFLDEERAHFAVSAELPLTSAAIVPGSTVYVNDTVCGVTGKGKVVSVTTDLQPGKTTRKIEVKVPC